MLNKNLLKEAHKMTKEIKKEYKDVDYRAQLGICISYLCNNKEVEKMEKVKLEGTEKQVKWAEEIRKNLENALEDTKGFEDVEIWDEDCKEKIINKLNEIKAGVSNEKDSKWFINSRHFIKKSENGFKFNAEEMFRGETTYDREMTYLEDSLNDLYEEINK